jgi:hypothetical protein
MIRTGSEHRSRKPPETPPRAFSFSSSSLLAAVTSCALNVLSQELRARYAQAASDPLSFSELRGADSSTPHLRSPAEHATSAGASSRGSYWYLRYYVDLIDDRGVARFHRTATICMPNLRLTAEPSYCHRQPTLLLRNEHARSRRQRQRLRRQKGYTQTVVQGDGALRIVG